MKYLRGCEIKQIEVAEDFYETYKRCLASYNNCHVSIPAFANGFFACELYLKSILKAKGIEATGHDVAGLFRKLPIDVQDAIKTFFLENAEDFFKLYKITFDELLDKVSFGFEFWRYIYEDKNKNFEDSFPFAYSECFLENFLLIIDRIAKDTD